MAYNQKVYGKCDWGLERIKNALSQIASTIPVEQNRVKEYIEKWLEKGKIKRSKPPYGLQLFFVKEEEEGFGGVVDWRDPNELKKNNALISVTDEVFDFTGHANVYSKINLITGFY